MHTESLWSNLSSVKSESQKAVIQATTFSNIKHKAEGNLNVNKNTEILDYLK